MAADEGGIEWLYELLHDVQLEQFATRIRDDLQVILYDESIFSSNMKFGCSFRLSWKKFSFF